MLRFVYCVRFDSAIHELDFNDKQPAERVRTQRRTQCVLILHLDLCAFRARDKYFLCSSAFCIMISFWQFLDVLNLFPVLFDFIRI